MNPAPTACSRTQRAVSAYRLGIVALAGATALIAGCASLPGVSMSETALYADREGIMTGPHQTQLIRITPDLVERQADPLREPEYLAYRELVQGKPDQYRYRLGTGDVLGVRVWGHPELSTDIEGGNGGAQNPSARIVNPEGKFYFPFLGEITAAGLTTSELRTKMSDGLSRYLESPQLDVRVLEFRSQKVYIAKELDASGVVASITDVPLTLIDALNLAGRSSANRQNGSSFASLGASTAGIPSGRAILTRDGRRIKIDIASLYQAGYFPGDVLMEDGDILFVPSGLEDKVFVMGETNQQQMLLMRNGRMSLAEALSQANGLNLATSDAYGIYVIRGQERFDRNGEPYVSAVVYQLDGRRADSMILADQFALQPRDVVFASAYGLTRVNRVIAQIVPSLGFATQVRFTDAVFQ